MVRPVLPNPRHRLLAQLAGAAALAALITVAVVWPAELHRDPTGFGRLSGLLAQSVPVAAAPLHAGRYRSQIFEIPLAYGQEREFKLQMRQGATLVYQWQVLGPHPAADATATHLDIEPGVPGPDRVYVDFHGESRPPAAPLVQSYRKQDAALRAQGALVAPFDGVHGWYFLNDSQQAVVLRLQVAGFYEPVADGPAPLTGPGRRHPPVAQALRLHGPSLWWHAAAGNTTRSTRPHPEDLPP